MASVSLVLTFLATYFCCANGQNRCPLAGGGSETCKSLNDCPSLLEITKKTDITPQEGVQLLNSHCGRDGNTPMVCCPNSCVTPDGHRGNCLSLYSCPQLTDRLIEPVSMDNIKFVNSSKCIGSQKYSVCCDLSQDSKPVPIGNCAATVSAFPPDPRTECCGVDSSGNGRIHFASTVAVTDQYPWLAVIEYFKMDKDQLMCGGALISGRYVLTAAHCVTGLILELGTPKNVRLGEYNTKNNGIDCGEGLTVETGGADCTEGTVTVPIEKLIPHPDYSSTNQQSPNDIALIRLARQAPFTDFIRPICLPVMDVTLSPPEHFIPAGSGWGVAPLKQLMSNLKLKFDWHIVNKDICEQAYEAGGMKVNLTIRQFCAGGTWNDTCKGDSGGPVMNENGRNYEVIGVNSFGPKPCGLANIPGVHTKVYEYNAWIRNTIVA